MKNKTLAVFAAIALAIAGATIVVHTASAEMGSMQYGGWGWGWGGKGGGRG